MSHVTLRHSFLRLRSRKFFIRVVKHVKDSCLLVPPMYKSWTKYFFKYLTLLILVVYNCWYAVKKLSICVDINRVGLQQPWFQWTKQFHFFKKKKKKCRLFTFGGLKERTTQWAWTWGATAWPSQRPPAKRPRWSTIEENKNTKRL
jgi:hypothetical protein